MKANQNVPLQDSSADSEQIDAADAAQYHTLKKSASVHDGPLSVKYFLERVSDFIYFLVIDRAHLSCTSRDNFFTSNCGVEHNVFVFSIFQKTGEVQHSAIQTATGVPAHNRRFPKHPRCRFRIK